MLPVLLTLFFAGFTFFNSPDNALAHGSEAPFQVLLNGDPTIPNEISTTIPLKQFVITEDIAVDPFVINQPISFEVIHEANHNHPQFIWIFSNGQTFSEESGQITFSKPGSYIANVLQTDGEEENAHTILLHILPEDTTSLPTSRIQIDDVTVPTDEAYEVDLAKPLEFTATGNDKNTYIWNFDNGDILEGKSVTYTYLNPPFLTSPILRIVDENGLYSDSQVSLKNSTFGAEKSTDYPIIWAISLVTIGIISLLLIVALSKKLKRRT